jgi:hypothetical protein
LLVSLFIVDLSFVVAWMRSSGRLFLLPLTPQLGRRSATHNGAERTRYFQAQAPLYVHAAMI